MDKVVRRLVFMMGLLAVVGLFGWRWWTERQAAAQMAGIVSANGRLEAVQVNISSKEPGRVVEILVDEGDMVEPGQVLAKMDIETLNADLAKAKADLLEAESNENVARSTVVKRESELKLAQQNFDRQEELFKKKVNTKQDFDRAESDLY